MLWRVELAGGLYLVPASLLLFCGWGLHICGCGRSGRWWLVVAGRRHVWLCSLFQLSEFRTIKKHAEDEDIHCDAPECFEKACDSCEGGYVLRNFRPPLPVGEREIILAHHPWFVSVCSFQCLGASSAWLRRRSVTLPISTLSSTSDLLCPSATGSCESVVRSRLHVARPLHHSSFTICLG